MKKLLSIVSSLMISLTSMACWFTEENFDRNYIASINETYIHTEISDIMNVPNYYYNDMEVPLPITVQVKIGTLDVKPNNFSMMLPNPLTTAVLQYKIVRSNGSQTNFVTVKELNNVNWTMDFSVPVNLFGSDGIIDIPESNISVGDYIIIRVYLSTGIYSTGYLFDALEIPNSFFLGNDFIDLPNLGISSPFVCRVKYNGKRRLII